MAIEVVLPRLNSYNNIFNWNWWYNVELNSFWSILNKFFYKIKLRWRTPLQATGYVRAPAPNSVKVDNNSKKLSLSRS